MDADTLSLIQNHGYWIMSLAVILFDVPAALASGYLLGRGQVEIAPTALALFAGRFSFEMILFYFARYRLSFLSRFLPRFKAISTKGSRLMTKHPVIIFSLYHFIFGTKLAVPIGSGMTPNLIRTRFFLFYNAIGLALWLIVMLTLGWALTAWW